jgi:hypothetical protein
MAFTIPGKGQYHWIHSPMLVFWAVLQVFKIGLRSINNITVYIDYLLIHIQNHEDHLQVLDQVLQGLMKNQLRRMIFFKPRSLMPWINLDP